jgi:hypothetical protein
MSLGTYVPVCHWKQQCLTHKTLKKAARAKQARVSLLHSQDSHVLYFAVSDLPVEDVKTSKFELLQIWLLEASISVWWGDPYWVCWAVVMHITLCICSCSAFTALHAHVYGICSIAYCIVDIHALTVKMRNGCNH